MAKKKASDKKPIEQYDHKGKKRVNNPPIGLVTLETDKEAGKKTYAYDPHIDPALNWAGKKEHTSFEVPIVSLHVHERIDPRSIVEAVRKKNGKDYAQMSLFRSPDENPPLRDAIAFYKHKHNWSNRLIAGDSLLIMNSLLEKEGMAGQVQMIYIDPPYGIKYGSNFQPFVNKRDVKDGKDEDLTAEPEMIKAFRDTWELGIHSYLTYLRDRLLLARDLLNESGSIFVQISEENVHLIRCLMDESFGVKNFIAQITFRKKLMPLGAKTLESMADFLVWYSKEFSQILYRQLYKETTPDAKGRWTGVELSASSRRPITKEERKNLSLLPDGARVYQTISQWAPSYSESNVFDFHFNGKIYRPAKGQCWVTSLEKMRLLADCNRLEVEGDSPRYVMFHDDFPYSKITNPWDDTAPAQSKQYVVQTNEDVISRCILMTTNPGDLVFDPTCGSGTTADVAEQWGRRWITCDTSRVAITLAKQRLMTVLFDYYELAQPQEGVGSGFKYKTVRHITLKSIANNEPPSQETLFDQPFLDNSRVRVTGPFTVEAVPAPVVKSLDEVGAIHESPSAIDQSLARSGETLRQAEWRDELLKTGIRGKKGQYILFSRVEPLGGTRWLHAEAETKPNDRGPDSIKEKRGTYGQPQRAVISFGPEHAPLDKKQVEQAIQEAQKLVPKPTIVIFAAFQFDAEAAKDIDETNWPGVTLLKAQMNADLLTDDLKKKRASNESFWLIGQPDVILRKAKGKKEMYEVEVLGFDYYNTKTGTIESGGTENIAIWMLDTDYDGRSLFPKQVFFPMAGEKDGWSRLARNLKAEIDQELIESYRGTLSLPFKPGDNNCVAVKIVDDRGIESLKILEVDS